VVPLLLSGEDGGAASFPPLLHRRTHVDFRRDDRYFLNLIELIIKMYGLPFDDMRVSDLRASVQEQLRKAGVLRVA
jgi:hypothetical protein